MKKKSIGLIVMGLLMFLVLAACGSKSADNSTSQKFHSGVPGVYSGYYGKNGDTKKNFVGMEFQNDQVTVGKLKLKNIQYKQLNSDTYMIKGKTSGSKTAKYLKVGIRVKRNKTYLGIYGDYNKTSDLTDYDKVNNRGKDDVDWFKSYSKEKYDNMTGKTDSEDTESTEETDSSNTNNSSTRKNSTTQKSSSSSVPASYFEGKIFMDESSEADFISFSAGDNFMMYWTMKAGPALENPTYMVHGNKLTVSGTPNMQGEGGVFPNNEETFTILSKTRIKSDKLGYTYYLFDGDLDAAQKHVVDTNNKVMEEHGYDPVN